MATPPTAPDLLRDLVATDPTRPRLTWYDDAEGPTRGERIELSGRVLATWTAKAANWLQEDLDAGPGSVVAVDLPTHWRAAYWLLAAWSVGAHAHVVERRPADDAPDEPAPDADVVVTDDPHGSRVVAGRRPDAHVVAVSLPALARSWSGADLAGVTGGALDEAAELSSYGDVHVAWEHPDGGDPALTARGRTWSHDELVPAASDAATGLASGARVLTGHGPSDVLTAWLPAWLVGGSLVLVRDADPALTEARCAAEQVTDTR